MYCNKNCLNTSIPKSTTDLIALNSFSISGTNIENLVFGWFIFAFEMSSSLTVDPRAFGFLPLLNIEYR
jgi:hypothetical protein